MASLCLLFTACETHEQPIENNYDQDLEIRSLDNISLQFKNASGNDTLIYCKSADVNFFDNTQAELILDFENSASVTCKGEDIRFTATNNFILEVYVDSNVSIQVDNIYLEVCEEDLCYTTSDPILFGNGLNFIVDDDPSGF